MLVKNAVRLVSIKTLLRHSSTFPSYGLEKKWAHYNQLAITVEAEKVFIFLFELFYQIIIYTSQVISYFLK